MTKLFGIFFLSVVVLATPAQDTDRSRLVADLQSPDPAVRAKAIKAMWPVNDKAAFRPLTQALRAALRPLIDALHDKDQIVRAGAVELLGVAGDPGAVDALVDALKDQDWIVRRDAILALSAISDPRAMPAIAEVSKSDSNPLVRTYAVEALIQWKDPSVPSYLLNRVLEDRDAGVRRAAAKGLGDDPRAIEALLAALDHPDPVPVIELLSEFRSPKVVEALEAATRDSRPRVRAVATTALARVGGSGAADGLLANLKDTDVSVRRAAAEALATVGGPLVIDPLLSALHDIDYEVRFRAAKALWNRQDPRVSAALADAWSRPDTAVLAGAVGFYIRRGEPGSEDRLILLLLERNDSVIAEFYLESGNPKLVEAARSWAKALGVRFHPDPDYGREPYGMG